MLKVGFWLVRAGRMEAAGSRGQLLLPLAVSLLIGCKALQLHAPLAAEEALGDLGPTPLLQSLVDLRVALGMRVVSQVLIALRAELARQ